MDSGMGKQRRLERILPRDARRRVILAIDHPRRIYAPALAAVPPLLKALVELVDGVMVTTSIATRNASALVDTPLVASLSCDHPSARVAVQQALASGFDAVKFEVFPGTETERGDYRMLESLAIECTTFGLPLMAEVVPGGFADTAGHTAARVAWGVRMAAECGADMAKVPFPTSGEVGEVMHYGLLPVFVLGGPKGSDDEAVLQAISDAARSGASGVVMGRFIFESVDPRATIDRIRGALATGAASGSQPSTSPVRPGITG